MLGVAAATSDLNADDGGPMVPDTLAFVVFCCGGSIDVTDLWSTRGAKLGTGARTRVASFELAAAAGIAESAALAIASAVAPA